MKRLLIVLMVIVMTLCSACTNNEQGQQEVSSVEEKVATVYEFKSEVVAIETNDFDIPATIVMPIGTKDGEKFPLVVMAHGHGGVRDVAGGFTRVAEGLAVKGIATIRMDFRGCGESTDSFANNNLTTMVADILSSIEYMVAKDIDSDRISILGYSMGGRAAILSSENIDYDVMATWAPAATNGATCIEAFLGGAESYQALRAKAESDKSTMFTTRFGQVQELGYKWFVDLEETAPLNVIKDFKGPLLILHGTEDDIIIPEVDKALAEAAVNSSNVVLKPIEGTNHGLGLYSEDTTIADTIVETTIDFLSENINK